MRINRAHTKTKEENNTEEEKQQEKSIIPVEDTKKLNI